MTAGDVVNTANIPSPTSITLGFCPHCNDVHVLLEAKDGSYLAQFILTEELLENMSEIMGQRKARTEVSH